MNELDKFSSIFNLQIKSKLIKIIKKNITTKKNKKFKLKKNLVDSLVCSVALWSLSSIALSNLSGTVVCCGSSFLVFYKVTCNYNFTFTAYAVVRDGAGRLLPGGVLTERIRPAVAACTGGNCRGQPSVRLLQFSRVSF
jgi:hypothetical protein